MPQTYRDAMRALEAGFLTSALAAHGGNVTHTARDLQLPLRTLQYRLHKLGIKPQVRSPEVPHE